MMNTALVFQPTSELSLQVRIARIKRRQRQVDVATAAGVRPHHVSRLECGKHIFTDKARRILDNLEIVVEELDAWP